MITPEPSPSLPTFIVESDPRVGDFVEAVVAWVDRLGGPDVVMATVCGLVLAVGVMFGVFLVGGTR